MQVAVGGEPYPDERSYPRARSTTVSPTFFDTLGLRVIDGRTFAASDTPASLPVAIVSERFARQHYPDGAIGRQVRVVRDGEPVVWRTIVGVVPDVFEIDFGDSIPELVYEPLTQRPSQFVSLVARVAGDTLAVAGPVRAAVVELDRNLPIYNVSTIQKAIDDSTWVGRVFGGIFTIFGLAGLFLATVGLYGVMAFSVSRRTQEFGVRMAVGADARSVVGLVLGQGTRQIAWGMAGGVGLAVALSRGMQLMFFQVNPNDPRIFAVVAALLLATGLAAAFVPARRASRVDPMTALRTQ